ncbi:MAG: nitrogen fixation protein NifQ [Campylobacterales bacterium]|nr:nitrogen fixation protein NifQ [Campylobacterales bacterium]
MFEEYLYEAVRDLLRAHAINGYAANILAPHVARTSLQMNHLYEDLGFKSRSEMGRFMSRNFPTLAAQKPKEKLWKKFLYDSIGAVAPACITCNDQATCFTCMLSEMSA